MKKSILIVMLTVIFAGFNTQAQTDNNKGRRYSLPIRIKGSTQIIGVRNDTTRSAFDANILPTWDGLRKYVKAHGGNSQFINDTSIIISNPNNPFNYYRNTFGLIDNQTMWMHRTISGSNELMFYAGPYNFYYHFKNNNNILYGDSSGLWSDKGLRLGYSFNEEPGTIRYNSGNLQLRNATEWVDIGSGTGTGNVTTNNISSNSTVPVFSGSATNIVDGTDLSGFAMYNQYNEGVKITHGEVSISSQGTVNIESPFILEDSTQVQYAGTSTEERLLGISETGYIKPLNLPISAGIEVTTETLVSGGDSVFVLPVPDALAGMNIIKIEAQPGEVIGDRTMSVKAYRNRAGTVTTITSTGASFSTPAVINTSYDDLQKGDRIYIGYTFTGGTTTGKGLWVTIYAQKP